MSETTHPRSGDEGTEVVKWYTRARRFPQLIGKTPDGATIWGGPYTYTQVIAGAALIVIGSKTTWLWGHFGLLGNAFILLGGAYGLVLLLGRLPIGSRNPLSVGSGALRALTSPPQGHMGGTPVRLRRPRTVRSRLVINPHPQAAEGTAHAVEPTASHARAGRGRRPLWSRPSPSQQPGAAVPTSTRLRPTPATDHNRSATPALSGVQRLLASSSAPTED